MSKFSKRLKKLKKNYRNIVVIGSAFGNLVELLDEANAVFVVSSADNSLRFKNLIYRENIESVDAIPEVDFVFIDKEHINCVPLIITMLRSTFPYIFVEGDVYSSVDQHKFLKSHSYKIIDIHKSYHLWKN